MRNWIKLFEDANVVCTPSWAHGQLTIKAELEGSEVGVLNAGYSGIAGVNRVFAASYMAVSPKIQSRGIGTALLEALKEELPQDLTEIHFYQVTSKGMLALIERIFGPAANEIKSDHLPDRMNMKMLRSARGPNVVVKL